MVKITISDEDGNTICTSGFSEEKVEYITDTNQWGYVMKTMLDTIKK